MITHRIKPDEIGKAYDGLLDDKDRYLGVVVNW
jgi:threonine dehydrogenase-like Zn-dependent dehydrogenase